VERETILKDASETVRAQLGKEEGTGRELTAAVQHLTADSAGLRQELQAAETRIREKTADGKEMAEELENAAVLAEELRAAEVKLRSQLVEAEGLVQQLKLGSEGLEGRLQETTAAWEAAEEREAEALNKVSAGSHQPEPVFIQSSLSVPRNALTYHSTYCAHCSTLIILYLVCLM